MKMDSIDIMIGVLAIAISIIAGMIVSVVELSQKRSKTYLILEDTHELRQFHRECLDKDGLITVKEYGYGTWESTCSRRDE